MTTERDDLLPITSVILYVDEPTGFEESELMAVLYFEEDSSGDSCSNCIRVPVTIANRLSITYHWGTDE
jgi:hypothetical protein